MGGNVGSIASSEIVVESNEVIKSVRAPVVALALLIGGCGTRNVPTSDGATDGGDALDRPEVDDGLDSVADLARDLPFDAPVADVQADSAPPFCTASAAQATDPCRIERCEGQVCDVSAACQAGGRLLCDGRTTCHIVAGPGCRPHCDTDSTCTVDAVGAGVNVQCNNVEMCTVKCDDACVHQCAERSTCVTQLRGGKVDCGRRSQCTATCVGPACSLDCWWFSSCNVVSQGDGATINCRQGSTCLVECVAGTCNLFCQPDAICKCNGPGCKITNVP